MYEQAVTNMALDQSDADEERRKYRPPLTITLDEIAIEQGYDGDTFTTCTAPVRGTVLRDGKRFRAMTRVPSETRYTTYTEAELRELVGDTLVAEFAAGRYTEAKW